MDYSNKKRTKYLIKMNITELNNIPEMLEQYPIIQETYPDMSYEIYHKKLVEMLPNSYKMVIVQVDGITVGVSGFWIGTKLWCGKYLELDNVIVTEKFRSKGIGKIMSNYLEEKARNTNCKMMALDAYTSNFAAHKFYYNQGFVPKGFHFIKILQ